ncbi:hypothetical protein [Desulfosarcina ovata]|uniref:Uncharacterized protein n=1 Tax=Desulfosarcina ovata subsp. ovata TaxID=2752305 RepID=A0A5K8ANI7_9BACT|nr:hypothetical protein [Desulfosarcina ovata]BBO93194.1 hypothetical protein DSCOOX_63740 [Desulfosarcina ovata subsp. ovata]
MRNYPFRGPFAEHIKNHVGLKQAVGYKYEAETAHLSRFSSFTAEKYRAVRTAVDPKGYNAKPIYGAKGSKQK